MLLKYYLVLDSKAASPADQDTALDFVCCIIVLDCAEDKAKQFGTFKLAT